MQVEYCRLTNFFSKPFLNTVDSEKRYNNLLYF
jgi:hypothetical protein